jgi:hypothetical protein
LAPRCGVGADGSVGRGARVQPSRVLAHQDEPGARLRGAGELRHRALDVRRGGAVRGHADRLLRALAVLGGDLDDRLLHRRPRLPSEGAPRAARLGIGGSRGLRDFASQRGAEPRLHATVVFSLPDLPLSHLRRARLRERTHHGDPGRRRLPCPRAGKLSADRAARPGRHGRGVASVAPAPRAGSGDQVHPAPIGAGRERRSIANDGPALRNGGPGDRIPDLRPHDRAVRLRRLRRRHLLLHHGAAAGARLRSSRPEVRSAAPPRAWCIS